MEAEKQSKESISRISRPRPGGGNVNIVDIWSRIKISRTSEQCIKQVSGKPIPKWIGEVLMWEAQKLLHEPDSLAG